MNKGKIIELKEKYALVYLPENAVEIEINAKVYENSELITVGKTLSLSEIKEAFDEYKTAEEIGYIPPDATFILTDTGKELVEKEK